MARRDLYELTPEGKLRFYFHPGQMQAWEATKRQILVLAGSQGGKTSWGPLWLWREMQRCGPGDYIVAAPTYPLLELKLLPEFKRLFVETLQAGRYVASPSKKFTVSERGAQMLWGETGGVESHVLFGHAQDPDSLESATAKAAWLDEAGQRKFRQGSYEALMRRLALHEGRVLITTTPYYHGWLKKQLHDLALSGDEDVDLIRFESRMNPLFSEAEWERAKRSLPAWRFDMFYRAKFTKPAGLIYGDFDEERHVVEPFAIPEKWKRHWGFDFGGVNTACVKLAEHPETGMLYLYEGYLAGGRVAKQHATHLLEHDQHPMTSVGGAFSEGNWRDEFSAAGLHISKPPISDVEVGIDRVTSLITSDRLRVFSDQERWLEEVSTYSRVLDEDSNPTEAIEGKNRYHLLDATRYVAARLLEQASTFPEPVGWNT